MDPNSHSRLLRTNVQKKKKATETCVKTHSESIRDSSESRSPTPAAHSLKVTLDVLSLGNVLAHVSSVNFLNVSILLK